MVTDPLVTLEEAKDQLRITHDLEDEQIALHMSAATEQVYGYLGIDPDDSEWDDTSSPAPDRVKGCVLELLTDNYFKRGDEDTAEKKYERSLAILNKWLLSIKGHTFA